MIKNKPPKLALGVALLITGFILLTNSDKQTDINPSNTFAQEPVSIEGFFEQNHQDAPVPKKIIIPSVGIDLVIEKSKIKSGYWEVFDDKAGWGEGSGFPGKPGNQVIFAHAREGLFLPLRSIEVGSNIYILTELGWLNYKVSEIKEMSPNQIEVIVPTQDETLTLYTCSGYKDSKRLIVTAKPT